MIGNYCPLSDCDDERVLLLGTGFPLNYNSHELTTPSKRTPSAQFPLCIRDLHFLEVQPSQALPHEFTETRKPRRGQQRHETKITVVVDRTSIITKAGEVARVVT